MNWILFDNQFNYVAASSGFQQVGAAGTINSMIQTNLPVSSSGFLYIYVSNSTPNLPVYFDNLQVTHVRGPMLEEEHYYPFGLTMQGISDKALKSQYAQNRYRYNGKALQNQEFSDGSGVNEYDYGARFYDQQLGRWQAIDPELERARGFSPYQYGNGNPVLNIDVEGKWSISNHYLLTRMALSGTAMTEEQADLLSHYASVYADHPGDFALTLNNNVSPFHQMHYRNDIDYSGTDNSQITDFNPYALNEYNYNIWHSMRSPQEAQENTISEEDAMLRGMQFGWSQIFESAKSGSLDQLSQNTQGIEQFGQGIHALQDAYAHKGTDIDHHNPIKDGFPGLNASWTKDFQSAAAISSSAVAVHNLLTGNYDALAGQNKVSIITTGMNADQINTVLTKIIDYVNKTGTKNVNAN